MIKIFNKFIKWLFSPSRTEVELSKFYFIDNYYNTSFKEYLSNSRKYLIKNLISKNKKFFDKPKKYVINNQIKNKS